MGRDKALIEVDRVAMVVRVATALRDAGCDPVFAVGGNQSAIEALGIRFVPDEHPGEGPVGGVLTAIAACTSPAVVVAACDLPYLTAATVSALIAQRAVADAVVTMTDRVQPMCVLWSRNAEPSIRDAFAGGERRVKAVLAELRTTRVAVNPQDLTNANTPGDLSQ
jgi:molybdopterin-guanine dinucleotide biosynthesis protein A